ncbi:MAG: M15 family metallopeptidase [Phocaeicola sp.]
MRKIKKSSPLLATLFLLSISTNAATIPPSAMVEQSTEKDQSTHPFATWIAESVVSTSEIEEYGIENCFTSCPIDSQLFARMKGKSYKENCTIPLEQLVYLKVLHYNLDGEIKLGEMVCNRLISNDLLTIFRALYDARYPIERMVLIDHYDADDNASMVANNSSGFNFRYISNTTRLSKHSMGLAVDINPRFNPFVRSVNGKLSVEPIEGKPYIDRTQPFPYKIDKEDLCYKLFIKHGFTWGGAWKNSKDYQHFEKNH